MEMTLTGEKMRETDYMESKLTVAELVQPDGGDGDATQVTVDTASSRTNPPSTSTSPVPAAVGDLPAGCPSGVLRVQKATHSYAAADEDELQLQPNDVVYVLTIPDPEDDVCVCVFAVCRSPCMCHHAFVWPYRLATRWRWRNACYAWLGTAWCVIYK